MSVLGIILKSTPLITETFLLNHINYLIEEKQDVHIFAYEHSDKKIDHLVTKKNDIESRFDLFALPQQNIINRILQAYKLLKGCKKINYKVLLRSLNFLKYGKQAINLSLFFEAQWFITNPDFDAIHIQFGHTGNRISELVKKGIIDPKNIVVTFHGYDLSDRIASKNFERYKVLLSNATIITVNSNYLKSQLLLKLPFVEKNKIQIIPMGTDSEKFKPHNPLPLERNTGDEFKVLFVGRLIKLKGPDRILEIASMIRKSRPDVKIQFEIIGDGELYESMNKGIKANKFDNIILRGSQNQEMIIERMQSSHLFILPGIVDTQENRAEAQGVVIQEAQACMMPAIVSDVGGMPEGIIDNETGFVVSSLSIEDFAKKILYFHDNEMERQKFGRNGRKFVIREFELKRMGSRFLNLYNC